ncbi:MAG: glycosyl transferase [Candidatus Parcubacteria bacterium]|nr:MAG: glycosyl transferase [Candidatus Parcubacteria bacterium]
MDKFLVEVSWEVANQVGGIYTVLKEKSKYINDYFKGNYFVIGPYMPHRSSLEFSKLETPKNFLDIINECKKIGFDVYFGEWLIDSRPKCFLIDFQIYLNNINSLKYELWAKYRIDSLRTGDDYNYPLAWSKAVNVFLKFFSEKFPAIPKILHLHEWLAGSVILFDKLPFVSIFTTHATSLGRTLSESSFNFWDSLDSTNFNQEATKYGIEAKHMIEVTVAKNADFFTTVSNILALETEFILGRKPDFVLPNGINLDKFPTVEEISFAHKKNRDTIKDFFLYFFSPYYRLETKNSLIYFISGRQEIRNKGIDIFIRSLVELNKKLKEDDPNIFVLILVPTEVKDIDPVLLNNLNVYRNLEEKIEDLLPEVKSRLIHYFIHKERIVSQTLFEKEDFLEIQRMVKRLKVNNYYPISTHILPEDNPIINLIKNIGLINLPLNKVKVIYYPTYIRRGDGLINLNYDELVVGSHVGIFPSLYEPWGYTPLETIASGVITITTDLTGFSDYISRYVQFNKDYPGLYILKRKGRRDVDIVEDLSNIMLGIAKLNKNARVENKIEARKIAKLCSWEKLISNYFNLYNIALNKKL